MTVTIKKDLVKTTFGSNALLGALDTAQHPPIVGYCQVPATTERELQTAAKGFWPVARCDEVARKILPKETGYCRCPTQPTLSDETVVCVLLANTTFDEKKPTQPIHALEYNPTAKCYAPLALASVDAQDKALWALKAIYEKAFYTFLGALQTSPAGDADALFANYEVARRNLEAALNYRAYQLQNDQTEYSDFFLDAQAFFDTHGEKELFADLIPKTTVGANEIPEIKANRCLDHYRAALKFFDATGAGRYASDATKEALFSPIVFNLHDALKESPYIKLGFQAQTREYLHFQSIVRHYSRPLTDAKFRKAIVAFLFDKNQKEPSEAFKRAVMSNPEQKRKLEQMAQIKEEAILKAQHNLFKKGVRGTILTLYHLHDAIYNMLSDSRFIGVEEIIRRALGKSDGWIPSRPFEDFLPDDDAELEELTKLRGINPQETEARNTSLEQLAYRVRRHIEQSFKVICHEDMPLSTCLTHAGREADYSASSAYYFNAAQSSLERDVYGRLQRLGIMDASHPDKFNQFMYPERPGYRIGNHYTTAQSLVDKKVSTAVSHLLGQLEAEATQDPTDRYASLPDDIARLEESLPRFTITPPDRDPIKKEHPGLSEINRLRTELNALAQRVQHTIANHRVAHPIGTAAQRAAAGTIAATTAEIKTLLENKVVLNAATQAGNFHAKAKEYLESAEEAAEGVLSSLEKIVRLDPQKRASHLRNVYEAFATLRELLANNITSQADIDAVDLALVAVGKAQIELAEAVGA